jgi:hypothetical protein
MAHCWATFLANLNEFYYQNPPQVRLVKKSTFSFS